MRQVSSLPRWTIAARPPIHSPHRWRMPTRSWPGRIPRPTTRPGRQSHRHRRGERRRRAGGGPRPACPGSTGNPTRLPTPIYPMLDDRTTLRADLAEDWTMLWSQASNRFGWESYLTRPCGAVEVPALFRTRAEDRPLGPASHLDSGRHPRPVPRRRRGLRSQAERVRRDLRTRRGSRRIPRISRHRPAGAGRPGV